MSNVKIINHPLIEHKLSILRDVNTSTKAFREGVSEIAGLITFEITRDLPLVDKIIQTPIVETTTHQLAKKVVIVPILRAGLGMVEGIHNLIPQAKVGHVGLYRDEESLTPRTYYSKFPENLEDSVVLVVDPMLATGGSAAQAIEILKEK